MVEVPEILPVDLSVSSVNLFKKCPERWRRRYIEGEFEPSGSAATLGSSIHAAEGSHFSQVIEDVGGVYVTEELDDDETYGECGLDTDAVLDVFSDEWEERLDREEIAFASDEKPGELKDEGARALRHYHESVAPRVRPISVERKFTLRFPGAQWTFRGYLDVEDARGHVLDLKVKKRKLTATDVRLDLQPTAILAARRLEGQPAPRFEYHQLIRPSARRKASAEVLGTTRTEQQCDFFLDRVASVANEIAWRISSGNWEGAVAGSWWCSEKWCGFYPTCNYVR